MQDIFIVIFIAYNCCAQDSYSNFLESHNITYDIYNNKDRDLFSYLCVFERSPGAELRCRRQWDSQLQVRMDRCLLKNIKSNKYEGCAAERSGPTALVSFAKIFFKKM